MTKPKTQEEFSNLATADFTWRLRELSNLKTAINKGDTAQQPTYLRALVVMCYAHWEGHVKFCGEKFLEFLTIRRLKFSEIKNEFYHVRFLKEITAANSMNYSQRLTLIEKILTSKEDRFSHFPKELIDSKSNLNSSVLRDLCIVCCIDFDAFSDEADFIDRILLKRRNEVAHGENVFVKVIDADDLVDRTIRLMRVFREELEKSVILNTYRLNQ